MAIFRNIMPNRKLLIFLLVLFTYFVLILLSRRQPKDDRNLVLNDIEQTIKKQASYLACKQPNLPVNSPEIMKFVNTVPNIDCSSAGVDWVRCKTSCTVQPVAQMKHGFFRCSFTDVLRVDDYTLNDGIAVSTNRYDLIKSDVVRVTCKTYSKTWSATLTGIRKDRDVSKRSNWNKLPDEALKMNVLMFGFDSLSRNSFTRKLPKSYRYLTEKLDSLVLYSYNIVGDGTPQALIPILTGKTELELPDTRKRIEDTEFVDSYPLIWKDYEEAGYVTGFFEDVPHLGTFTYRLNGFDKQPTDHYMRPYYLASAKERNKWPRLCTGESPTHKVMMNQVDNFFAAYESKPKFLFAFHGELSHDDYNLVGVADDDFVSLIDSLNDSNALNNTVLIVMADHGHRFAEIRNTIQGKQEERLPFFSFAFPKWFEKKHRKLYENFKSNRNKLATPFDIHATLKNILNVDEAEEPKKGDLLRQRSISLFDKIPAERSCAHAYIEPHWCACLDWQNIDVSHPIVSRLSETLSNGLNNITLDYRHLCEVLHVSEVKWAMKLAPNRNLLRFSSNADLDGFVADLSAKMEMRRETYQIKAVFEPGESIFEASIGHSLEFDRFELKLSDVSRINMYGRQARCVENDFPQLRKFCYCKN